MAERLSNLGYCMIKKEATKGTAVIPTIAMPMISDSIALDPHLEEIKIIAGNKAARYKNLMGQRYTSGEATFLAEPNTAGYLADMILTKASTSGSGTYTHTFGLSAATDPNSYTVEIMKGQIPYRMFGVESSRLGISFDGNTGIFTTQLHSRGVFSVAEITNVASTVLTLSTTYSSTPTAGLVATDVIRLHLAGGTVVDTTVSSVTATTVTVASAGAVAIGDFISLRALTPALSLSEPATWGRTEFRYSYTDASTALSASQTALEADSGAWTIMHGLEEDEGKARSGSWDRAFSPRTTGDFEISTKQFFDGPASERDLALMKKRALVVRHFASTAHEIRVTANNMKATAKPNNTEVDNIIYDEFNFRPEYDASDAAIMGMVVINAVSTV